MDDAEVLRGSGEAGVQRAGAAEELWEVRWLDHHDSVELQPTGALWRQDQYGALTLAPDFPQLRRAGPSASAELKMSRACFLLVTSFA